MKRAFAYALAILTLALAAFVLSRLPVPSSKARDAVGERLHRVHHGNAVTYYISGPEHSRDIIYLLASAGREASDFNELVITLNNAGFQTVSVESMGINGTTLQENSILRDMTLPMSRTRVRSYIDKRVHLIGHAYGNRVVRYLAYLRPSSITSVTLLAAGGQNEIDPPVEQKLRDIFNPLLSAKKRQQNIADIFFAKGNEIPDHWKRGWHTKTAIAQGKAKGLNLAEDWQGAGGVPMLIVQPAQDVIAPKEDTADVLLARYSNQVEVVVIENAGHALLPEQPEAVAEAVIEFLGRMSSE